MGHIRTIAGKILPQRYYMVVDALLVVVRYLYGTVLFFGLRLKCPCCGGSFRKFLPAKPSGRPDAICPACECFERHRLLWLYLKNKTNFFTDRLKVLDIAPRPFLQWKYKIFSNLDYVSADILSPGAELKIDITSIPLADNQFDCVICYHVLEHIPDDRKALKELFRVLKPDGWAIMQSPIDINREETFENPNIISPEDRERVFGQKDHVRIYGRDYKGRLEEVGFLVKVDDYVNELGEESVKRYGLMADEKIYFCSKPK